MTLQEVKYQVAQTLKFKDWDDLKAHHSKEGIEISMNEVAELYARAKWDECYQETISNINWPYQETEKPDFKP